MKNYEIVIIGAFIAGIILGGIISAQIFYTPSDNNTTQQNEVVSTEEEIPQKEVEIIQYHMELEEFSLHCVSGTILNQSDHPVSVLVSVDAYDENDKYINTYTALAQYLDAGKKWDFYIKVSEFARKATIRDVEVLPPL